MGLNKECILRLDAMYSLYKKCIAPEQIWWVIPAGSRKEELIISNAMKQFLIKKGVPAEMIFTGRRANNTYAEVLESLEIIEKNGLPTRIVVGSSRYHIRRVSFLWRKIGCNVEVIDYVKAPHWSSFKNRFLRETVAYIKDWSTLYNVPLLPKILKGGPRWV